MDSFIVGLISIAIAIPVSMFIAACFAIANDADAPESWLEWVGWRKLVFGANAHRRWHYTGSKGQPGRHVKWYVRSSAAAAPETLINLWHSLVCALTGRELPWLKAAREAKEKKEQHAAHGQAPEGDKPDHVKGDAASGAQGGEAAVMEVEAPEDDAFSVSSSVREARALSRYKRLLATTGFVSVYVVWAIFTWVRDRLSQPACAHTNIALTRYPFCQPPVHLFLCVSAARTMATAPSSDARTAAQTACSSTSCSATTRSSSLRARGASASACACHAAPMLSND